MIWTIAKKQFLTNILTYKFIIGFILCQILFISSAVVLTRDYEQRLASFGAAAGQHAGALREVKVYSQLTVTVDKPPARLSALCQGFDKRFANAATVSYREIPEIRAGQAEKNPLMVVLDHIDLTAIVQIVLGLLVLLFAYDLVSGERERGTLAQILSNNLPRTSILLGQYLGGMLLILPLVLIGMLAALLIMIFSPSIALSSTDWGLLGLIIMLSLIYLSALYLLGMLISVVAGRSATSLVVVLFFWVVFIILFPHAGAYVAHNLRPMGAKAVVDAEARDIRSEFWRRLRDYAKDHRRPPHQFDFIKGRSVYTGDIPYPIRIYYAPKEVMLWELEGLKYCLRLDMEYTDRIHNLYRDRELALARQASLARALARLSPAWVYYQAASVLVDTDANSSLRFLEQARRYRRELIDYVRSKNGLFSAAYFTRVDVSKLLSTAELERLKSKGQRVLDELIGPGWDDVSSLDLGDLPNFNLAPETVSERLARAAPELGILILLNLLFFLIAQLAFLKTDVRPN